MTSPNCLHCALAQVLQAEQEARGGFIELPEVVGALTALFADVIRSTPLEYQATAWLMMGRQLERVHHVTKPLEMQAAAGNA